MPAFKTPAMAHGALESGLRPCVVPNIPAKELLVKRTENSVFSYHRQTALWTKADGGTYFNEIQNWKERRLYDENHETVRIHSALRWRSIRTEHAYRL
jgi:hypothetical protein